MVKLLEKYPAKLQFSGLYYGGVYIRTIPLTFTLYRESSEICGEKAGNSWGLVGGNLRENMMPSNQTQKGGEKSVLKTELEVVKIGEPDIATLPEGEQRAFFETLYARVLELAKEDNKD